MAKKIVARPLTSEKEDLMSQYVTAQNELYYAKKQMLEVLTKLSKQDKCWLEQKEQYEQEVQEMFQELYGDTFEKFK